MGKSHKKYVKTLQKQKFCMPKRTLPKTPDIEVLMTDEHIKQKNMITITVRNDRWLHIDNYSYIADYSKQCIKIVGKQQILAIEGQCLAIIYFTEDDILIEGKIRDIRYIGG